jgi:dTMP kinase
MPPRGKLIVLEGIDGSGKRTQAEALAKELSARGIEFAQIDFPRYDGFFGRLVAQFLNGEFGSLEAVDPHFSALLYAGDRLEAKPRIEAELSAGKLVLADRYIGSNLAHQGARIAAEKRAAFLDWLGELEYKIYDLPKEDVVVYLEVPTAEAHRLIGEKAAREYTQLRRDLQEADMAHLERASQVYDQLACQPNWVKIECAGPDGALLAPEAIHQRIWTAIEVRIGAAIASRS